MRELEKKALKNELDKIEALNSKGFTGFSKALQAEVLDIKNRKFREYLFELLDTGSKDDDRIIILDELAKKNKMFRLFKADSLMVVLASEHGNELAFRKYLYTQTDLTILEIAAIINESVATFDKEVTSRKWKKIKRPQRVDFPLLRAIILSGGKKEQFNTEKISDPEEIRRPFRALIDQIMKEIELRISRTALVNTNETENLFTLMKTIEKGLALAIEVNGDLPNMAKERIRIEDEKNAIRREELRLSRLGGTIMSIKSFSDTELLTAEEMFLIMKNTLFPFIDAENIEYADEEVKKIAVALSNGEKNDEPN